MTDQIQKKTMAKETFLYLPAKLFEGFIGIFTISCYAALFTPDAYGDYLLLNTIVIFSSLVLTGWLINSTTRFVGENTQPEGIKGFFTTALAAWGTITIFVYLLCLLMFFLSGQLLIYLCPAFMFTSYSLFQIMSAALVQLRKIKLNITLSLTSACLKLAIAYGVFFVLPDSMTLPYPAIAATFFSDLIAALIALIALGIPRSFSPGAFSVSLSKQFFKYGFPLMGVSVSIGLLNLVDRFIVSGFADNSALAVYNANYSISSSVFTLIMAAVMRGVFPSILEGFRRGGKDEVLPLVNYGTRMYIIVAMPAAAGLVAVSASLSKFIFIRPEYAEGIPVIGLVAIAMFFMGLAEYANKAWELQKNTIPILQNSAVAVLVKIISSIFLIRLMGLNGAALGTLLAFSCYFFLTAVRVRKLFLFHLPLRSWLSFIFASSLCGICAFLISACLPAPNTLRLLLAIIAGMILYSGSLIICGELRQEALKLWSSLSKKR